MRGLDIVRGKLDKKLGRIHASRRKAVWRVVVALLTGGSLWGAALGRSLPGTATDKSNIKMVDRLLGNALLHAELKIFYAQLTSLILRALWTPIILVDITEVHPGICALTASLAHDGRGLPIYSMVRSKKYIAQRRCQKRFLKDLEEILPQGVRPILVTDAGFQSPWFDEVEGLDWYYVGRVRHETRFEDDGQWVGAKDLHKKATSRAKNLGMLSFPRSNPVARRLVLSKARKSQGRRRLNTRGKKGRTANDKRNEKSAREPWLLATNMSSRADSVVEVYGLRMQIEQNYRDIKNHRWGWSLDQSGSREHSRIEILLLIAALGALVHQTLGCAAENQQLHPRFQANTVRDRRVISLFVLGGFLLQNKNKRLLTDSDIRDGFTVLCQKIRAVES